jgi:hypothetical protein
MGGKDLNFQVVYRGEVLEYYRPGGSGYSSESGQRVVAGTG